MLRLETKYQAHYKCELLLLLFYSTQEQCKGLKLPRHSNITLALARLPISFLPVLHLTPGRRSNGKCRLLFISQVKCSNHLTTCMAPLTQVSDTSEAQRRNLTWLKECIWIVQHIYFQTQLEEQIWKLNISRFWGVRMSTLYIYLDKYIITCMSLHNPFLKYMLDEILHQPMKVKIYWSFIGEMFIMELQICVWSMTTFEISYLSYLNL